ncbi:MAG: hypothetical protein WB586_23380 [Chthoniobacterales bacterium]
MKYLLATSVLFAGICSAFADMVFVDGQAINVWQDGPYLHVGDQTYTAWQNGSYLNINRIGPNPSTGPSYVPNLTLEQVATYLNSTAEGRAASAKFDADLKASSAKFDADLRKSSAQLAAESAAPRATLIDPYPGRTAAKKARAKRTGIPQSIE